MSALTIDFVSDVICPWCFIGFTRLEQALAGEGGEVDLTLRPFQLDPSIPATGVDLRDYLAKKLGGANPDTMFARVEAAAKESGIALDFSKIRRAPNTLAAHALIGAAKAKGTQRAIAKAIFSAYFLEGRDLSDNAVLTEIGVANGLSGEEVASTLGDTKALAEVREQAKELSAQGISGVPFTVFDGKLAVSGAQPLAVFREAIARARSTADQP
jgi:predicted DsbA family dithiol-disulfide isomerase